MGLGVRVIYVLLALAAACAALVYVDRVFLDAPVYAGAESGHLIEALFGGTLSARPGLFPDLDAAHTPAFSLLIRGATYLSHNLLQWMRVGGGLAYLAGIGMVLLAGRRSLTRERAAIFLLLALAYPYHRFAMAVLPAGWTAGLVGLTALLTARIFFTRPVLHASACGAIAGLLTMMGPHGLALAAAFAAVTIADLLLGRRDVKVAGVRLAVFALALPASADLVLLLAGLPLTRPFTAFVDPAYLTLGQAAASAPARLAAERAVVAIAAASLMLAGAPLLTGLLRIELRWRWTRTRERFHLEPQEAMFLLLATMLVATAATTALSAMADRADPSRLWGRQFEFLIPMLWLAAAPFIGEFERGGGRWWRLAVGASVVLGLGGVLACLATGVQVRPWDTAALAPFARDVPLATPVAAGLVIAAAVALAVLRAPIALPWIGCLVSLSLLAAYLDVVAAAPAGAEREALAAETAVADALVGARSGGVALAAPDLARAKLIYWRMRARPEVVVAGSAPVPLRGVETLVSGRADRPGPGWRPLFRGRQISVFVRDVGQAAAARPKAGGGEALLSAPGSG